MEIAAQGNVAQVQRLCQVSQRRFAAVRKRLSTYSLRAGGLRREVLALTQQDVLATPFAWERCSWLLLTGNSTGGCSRRLSFVPLRVLPPEAQPIEPQLIKFEKKVAAGAEFFQTQLMSPNCQA